ncbi:uncharacterized protein LOC111698235 [Eurytemora carolleeae]|uniref:uncharacterized protein LOC111698235 n=1 Tax=Eurytemora carolleeae TaxID=1294199 RepID=UPI000C78A6D6|nr:uncharacterized protein LOC111698235 [Eurytemora carolleeae]|eukprot:XP_023324286.1 uncharacterized protein LOC111698235 [Eurytemora affinis]
MSASPKSNSSSGDEKSPVSSPTLVPKRRRSTSSLFSGAFQNILPHSPDWTSQEIKESTPVVSPTPKRRRSGLFSGAFQNILPHLHTHTISQSVDQNKVEEVQPQSPVKKRRRLSLFSGAFQHILPHSRSSSPHSSSSTPSPTHNEHKALSTPSSPNRTPVGFPPPQLGIRLNETLLPGALQDPNYYYNKV